MIKQINLDRHGKGVFSVICLGIIYDPKEKKILIGHRANDPNIPALSWCFPGGRPEYGEELETAVKREIKEETGLDFLNFKQFKIYSKGNRDPRFHTASVVFIGEGKGNLKADSDAKAAGVFKLDSLPENIAFDHREVIKDYIQSRTK